MPSRFQELIKGFRSNLKFSNRFELVFNRLFRRNLNPARYVWKNRFVFECDTRRGDHISVQECFAERAYDPLLNQCHFPSGPIYYVNIGANVGAFDVLLVDRGLQIETGLAVEMNPHTARRCAENLRRNGLSSTTLINAAIGDTDGPLTFRPSGWSLGDNIFDRPTSGGIGGIEIEMLTLESLLKKYATGRSRFDLLKLDCEGAEYSILRLTPPAVLRRFAHIIAEFHPEPKGESVDAAYSKLKAAGFQSLRGRPGDFRFIDLFARLDR